VNDYVVVSQSHSSLFEIDLRLCQLAVHLIHDSLSVARRSILICPHLLHLFLERLEREFKGRAWEANFKLLQHRRMQDSKCSNIQIVLLHSCSIENACCASREIHGISCLLDIISCLSFRVSATDPRNLQHFHGSVQHTMHDLEACGLVAPHSRGVSLVTRLALSRAILEDNVRSFEYLDWQWMRTILANRFK